MTYTDAEFNLAYKEILERVLVNKTPENNLLPIFLADNRVQEKHNFRKIFFVKTKMSLP